MAFSPDRHILRTGDAIRARARPLEQRRRCVTDVRNCARIYRFLIVTSYTSSVRNARQLTNAARIPVPDSGFELYDTRYAAAMNCDFHQE